MGLVRLILAKTHLHSKPSYSNSEIEQSYYKATFTQNPQIYYTLI